jgi:hypothetical protein
VGIAGGGNVVSLESQMGGGLLVFSDSFDPGWRGRELSALLKYRGEDGWGPRPPPRKPGDRYVVAGAVVGMSAGGILGFTVGIVTGMLGIAAGGVSGALIGSLAGSLLGQRK